MRQTLLCRYGDGNWGGVLAFFSEEQTAFERADLRGSNSTQSVWLDITINSQKLLLGTVYRPPSDVDFFGNFQVLIESLWLRRNNLIIVCDLNSDMKKGRHDEILGNYGTRLRNILGQFNLKNVINSPTRITHNSMTIIDLILTSDLEKMTNSGTWSNGLSDHHLVYTVVSLKKKQEKPILKEVQNYKNIDRSTLSTLEVDFDSTPWDICNVFDDVEDSVWAWEFLYKNIMKDHIKKRKAKIRAKSHPWVNSTIRKMMNKTYRLLLRAQRTKCEHHWKEYRKARNQTTKMCRISELNYWKGRLEKCIKF